MFDWLVQEFLLGPTGLGSDLIDGYVIPLALVRTDRISSAEKDSAWERARCKAAQRFSCTTLGGAVTQCVYI